jgi:hypothetical protein
MNHQTVTSETPAVKATLDAILRAGKRESAVADSYTISDYCDYPMPLDEDEQDLQKLTAAERDELAAAMHIPELNPLCERIEYATMELLHQFTCHHFPVQTNIGSVASFLQVRYAYTPDADTNRRYHKRLYDALTSDVAAGGNVDVWFENTVPSKRAANALVKRRIPRDSGYLQSLMMDMPNRWPATLTAIGEVRRDRRERKSKGQPEASNR